MLRSLLCGVAILGTAVQAHAADLSEPFLRGSTVVAAPAGPRWDGFYIGVHAGMSVPGIDFTNNTRDVRSLLAGTGATSSTTMTALGNQDSTSKHFGGFVGYNTQWDGAVISIEGTYNWLDKALTATNTFSGGFVPPINSYTAVGSETARILDYGTLRVRGGWAAGMFMPYATFGLAIGRMDINRSLVVTPTGMAAFPPVSQDLLNQFGYGWAAGLGVDFCLLANLFARAEYEYVQFPDLQGLNAHIHNVRIGAALKF